MDRCKIAKEYHERGCNCAQSVLAAFGDLTHLSEGEALALAGATNAPTAAPTPQTEFDRIAKAWPDSTRNAAEMWRIARLINARPDGQLVLGQTPLDWRRDLAQILITAQRSDPKGGGYWDAPTEDRRIEETAFALLTLLEL